MKFRAYRLGSLNLKVSPLIQKEGDLISSVNIDSGPYGAKKKRMGYQSLLGTMPNGSAVTQLFNWQLMDGTTFWNYAVAGGVIYNSYQGTGVWTVCGNGTFTSGSVIGNAVLNETLVVGDNVGTIRWSTNGTSFVTPGTASGPVPIGNVINQYQNRIYVGGTGSILAYSVTGDPTNWNTSGTSDSNNLTIPGAGKINGGFVAQDRLIINKNSNKQFRWDGYSLVQIPTNRGLTSQLSLGTIEDYAFYLNRNGFYSHYGDIPQLLSIAIEKQIFNDANTGIAGGTFEKANATAHRYKYLAYVGTVGDDLSGTTVSDCIEVYDHQLGEWGNYTFANKPDAFLSYKDNSGSQQLMFASGNQCYQFNGTLNNDNGLPIEARMQGVIHLNAPESEKEWKYIWAMGNPGCQAKVQVAMCNTFTNEKLQWVDLGQASDGVYEFRFPSGSRSRLLMWRVYESSRNARFDFYGWTVEANIIDRK